MFNDKFLDTAYSVINMLNFLPEDFVSTHSHLLLVYQQPLISPLDDKEGIEGDAEVLVVNLGDVLDVDPHVHHCARLVGKVKFGIVFWNADGVPLKDGTCYCYLSIKACTHIAPRALGSSRRRLQRPLVRRNILGSSWSCPRR